MGRTFQSNIDFVEDEGSDIDELKELEMRTGFVKSRGSSFRMPALK